MTLEQRVELVEIGFLVECRHDDRRALFLAYCIDDLVLENPGQPRLDARASRKPVAGTQCRNQRLLHDVLGEVRVAKLQLGYPHQIAAVSVQFNGKQRSVQATVLAVEARIVGQNAHVVDANMWCRINVRPRCAMGTDCRRQHGRLMPRGVTPVPLHSQRRFSVSTRPAPPSTATMAAGDWLDRAMKAKPMATHGTAFAVIASPCETTRLTKP
jgi:hypothetical protein